MWVLGTKPRCSTKAAGDLNSCDFSLALPILILKKQTNQLSLGRETEEENKHSVGHWSGCSEAHSEQGLLQSQAQMGATQPSPQLTTELKSLD